MTQDIIPLVSTEDTLRQNQRFLVMLAHELRNPLAPIISALHMIEQQCKFIAGNTAIIDRATKVLRRQTQHLTAVIDNLLEVSMILKEEFVIKQEEVDLVEITKFAIGETESLFESRRHRVELKFPSIQILVKGDKKRLVQAISKIIINAAKYTETGGKVRIDISYGEKAIITVKDNGVGIDPKAIPQIFSLFTSADHTLHIAQGGGLGLGLFLARTIIDMHGGNIEASSEGVDKGSEFAIILPILRTEEVKQQFVETPITKNNKSLDILLVDDHFDTAETLSFALKLMGHRTKVAHTGTSALELAEINEPDVVFLDIGLPGIDGYEVCRKLRDRHKGIKIIAITGYGQEIDHKRTRAAGFDAHLVKPVEPDQIQQVLGK